MDAPLDLRDLLESWPYDEEDNLRRVICKDGREVLQVRLPLGIEQYELNGRPDGQRPYGKESVLQHCLERLEAAKRAGKEIDFSLSTEQCEELFEEGLLYYYRYLHLFQAKDWAGTVRDTARNLAVFDLVHAYAAEQDDRFYLEQWRPYLLRMNAAADAMLRLDSGEHEAALACVRTAVTKIEALEEIEDETFQFERERSLNTLAQMARQIEESRPVPEVELLERELQEAIETQRFEQAAGLRDRIRALKDHGEG
jgi:hypothetical protein